MPINNFIPEIWGSTIIRELEKALVYGQEGVVNRDYEGDITGQGSAVRINGIGPITIRDYAKNTDMAGPDALTDAQTVLTIDQAKYFNFQIDDIDKAQTYPKVMQAAMQQAAYNLADVVDQYIVAQMVAGVSATNAIGTDASPITGFVAAPAKAYEQLVDLGVKLTDAKVPMAGRWAIVPPWFYGFLQKDQRFVGAGTAQTDQTLRNGIIGQAAGFTVLQSHNVPNTTLTKYKILAGVAAATTFAGQISEVEAYRVEKRLADGVKGQKVFGAKVVRSTALALMTANNA
jgi:N4-gp56 family major capsid protein